MTLSRGAGCSLGLFLAVLEVVMSFPSGSEGRLRGRGQGEVVLRAGEARDEGGERVGAGVDAPVVGGALPLHIAGDGEVEPGEADDVGVLGPGERLEEGLDPLRLVA